MKYLEAWTGARRSRAAASTRRLSGTPALAPAERPASRRLPQCVVRVPERDAWRTTLTEAGVQTRVHYPIPVHLGLHAPTLECSRGDFPVAEQAATEVLSLPMFPELTDEQIESILSVFRTGVLAGAEH